MKKTSLQTLGLLIALAGIVSSAPLLWQLNSGQDETAGLEIGQPMPPFTGVTGWLNGEAPSHEDLQGKVVVVNGWFLTCPYCHKGMPDLVELHEKYQRDDVVFVGLTFETEDNLSNVKRYLEKYNSTWPNAYGARDTLLSFKAEYFPGYWIIGRDGKVVWNKSLEGRVSMDDAIEKALAQQAS